MKIYFLVASFAFLSLSACGDGLNLPDLPGGVEKDLEKIPLPEDLDGLVEIESKDISVPLKHYMDGVYALHTEDDFKRIRQYKEMTPWKEGYEKLKSSEYSQLGWNKNAPVETIKRGVSGDENYINAARGAAAAYQMGLRWKIENNSEYAKKAVSILNAWASTTKKLGGNTNVSLAAGIYGYEFAIAGELLSGYKPWGESEDFTKYQQWMLEVFLPANRDFLRRHHDTNALHYWANWGLCNIASVMAIGILTDRRDIYNEAIEHFQTGETNGRMTRAIYHVFDGNYANFAQMQESGRDQGHTLMCMGLLGTICQLAYNQGDDFFKYKDNLFLKACEYVACFNYTNEEVPYVTYIWQKQGAHDDIDEQYFTAIGGGGKGGLRPIWALPYYHYKYIKGMNDDKCKYVKIAADRCFPEAGAGYGDYGGNGVSGAYDVLGFGTLMYARETE